jgi:hypothetical protein
VNDARSTFLCVNVKKKFTFQHLWNMDLISVDFYSIFSLFLHFENLTMITGRWKLFFFNVFCLVLILLLKAWNFMDFESCIITESRPHHVTYLVESTPWVENWTFSVTECVDLWSLAFYFHGFILKLNMNVNVTNGIKNVHSVHS